MSAIPNVDFINNSNQRTPCVLILDTSGSMTGDPIAALNDGIDALCNDLSSDPAARERVRMAVINAGGNQASVLLDWTDGIDLDLGDLECKGMTPLGGALSLALDMIDAERARLRAAGIAYTRPLIYLITDGLATDWEAWDAARERCRAEQDARRVQLWCIGTETADLEALRNTGGAVLRLNGLRFIELFQFLSRSVAAVSQAAPGERLQLTLPPEVLSLEA